MGYFFIGITMDISNIALAELKSLIAQIPKEIERREKEEKIKARKEIEAFAAERGFALSDLLDEAGKWWHAGTASSVIGTMANEKRGGFAPFLRIALHAEITMSTIATR